ncbi:MAG: pyruvate kinase [Flammeovirgaceae bacterium]
MIQITTGKNTEHHDMKRAKIIELLDTIDRLIVALKSAENELEFRLKDIHEVNDKSARNLIHYRKLRTFDLSEIQKRLQKLGLTRLMSDELHVLASLLKARGALKTLSKEKSKAPAQSSLSMREGRRTMTKNTKRLFGYRSRGRRVRIMVTQPTQAAYDYQMVYDMVKNGMNCARVNCAHDSPEVWEKIITNIRKASKKLGRKVKIAMDLAGPKIRTGVITPGMKVRKFTPERDESGNIVSPAVISLVTEITENTEPNTLPFTADWLQKLAVGDEFSLTDTRHKKRRLKVVEVSAAQIIIHAYETSYIGTGTVLTCTNRDLEAGVVMELPPVERALVLRVGDTLTITKEAIPGEPAEFNEDGHILKGAHISCQVPTVFEKIKEGDSVMFDDGKIGSVITAIFPDRFEVKITSAKEKGSKLKAEKGINFPNTNLGISGLTEKDRTDLAFVVKHADVVNFSFVNAKEDVEDLFAELEKWDALHELGIIFKIETKFAFDNLLDIILTGMKTRKVGVMIARGDLAVEVGWDKIGKIQQEILMLCKAAHVPVVWATQVLENLAKKGLPSRSEITDASSSLKAECVMLNKGAYINNVLLLLSEILSDMENFHDKLPKMEKA